MTKKTINAKTKLFSLELPHLDVILKEVFFIDTLTDDMTTEELSKKSDLSLGKTLHHLNQIVKNVKDLEYEESCLSLKPVFINLEQKESPYTLKDDFSVALDFWDPTFKDHLKKSLEAKNPIVFLSSNGKRAFSAAMYLRGQNYSHVYTLGNPKRAFLILEK